MGVTLKDHLVGIHFEQANDLYKNTVEQLPAAHPLRRLLLPHIYATPSINSGAAITLATEFGILHHAVALEWQALREAFVASRKALRAEPLWLDEHLQQRGMGNGDTDEDLMFYPCKSVVSSSAKSVLYDTDQNTYHMQDVIGGKLCVFDQ